MSSKQMKQYGLGKRQRLLKAHQFERVFKQGSLRKNIVFWAYFLPNGLGYGRIGVSVANKFCQNIVERNRIKRIIKEVYRTNKEKFGQENDTVFVLKTKPNKLSYKELGENLLKLTRT